MLTPTLAGERSSRACRPWVPGTTQPGPGHSLALAWPPSAQGKCSLQVFIIRIEMLNVVFWFYYFNQKAPPTNLQPTAPSTSSHLCSSGSLHWSRESSHDPILGWLYNLTIYWYGFTSKNIFSHNNYHSNIHLSEIFIKTGSIELLILILLLNISIHEQIRHH